VVTIDKLSSEPNKCVQCGACTSACAVSRATKRFNPRLLIYAAKKGLITEREDIWLCLNCHICEARCPNSVRVSDLILDARRKVLERHGEERVSEFYSSFVRALLNIGVMAFVTSSRVEDFKSESGLNIPMLTEPLKSELHELLKKMNLEARLKEAMGIERE
jgi:heterodisulfide reductase subunit C